MPQRKISSTVSATPSKRQHRRQRAVVLHRRDDVGRQRRSAGDARRPPAQGDRRLGDCAQLAHEAGDRLALPPLDGGVRIDQHRAPDRAVALAQTAGQHVGDLFGANLEDLVAVGRGLTVGPDQPLQLVAVAGRHPVADVRGQLAADDGDLGRLLGVRRAGRCRRSSGSTRSCRAAAGRRRAGAPRWRAPRRRCRSGSRSASGSGRATRPSSGPSSPRPTSRCRAGAGARSRTPAGRARTRAPARRRAA